MRPSTPIAHARLTRISWRPNGPAWRLPLGLGLLMTAAVSVGLRFSVTQQLIAVAILLGIVALLLLISRNTVAPATGLYLLLVSAVLAPLPMPRGLTGSFLLALFVCGHWLAKPLVLRRGTRLYRSRMVLAALLFAGMAMLAFVVGLYPWFPVAHAPLAAQLGGLSLFVVSGLLVLAAGHELRSVVHLQRLTYAFVFTGGVAVLILLPIDLPWRSTLDRILEPQSVGSLFWVWLVSMALGQALFNHGIGRPMRALCFAVGALALGRGLIAANTWASGWLPPLVGCIVLLALRFPRLTTMAGLLSIAPLVAVSGRLTESVMVLESYSWATRLEAWGVIFEIARTSPFLGLGPANYYHYTPLFPILGWWVHFSSHNNYVDFVAQTGVVGLAAFLWFVFESGRLTVSLLRRESAGFSRAYAASALAGLAGSLVAGFLGDWIIPFVYNIGMSGFRSSLLFWVFLGGVLALSRLTPLESRSRALATCGSAS